jgi:Zn finger protein HypA/HybF involved in hydrogenase expression
MRTPKIYKCTCCEVENYDYDLIIKTTTHYECPNCKTEIKIITDEK